MYSDHTYRYVCVTKSKHYLSKVGMKISGIAERDRNYSHKNNMTLIIETRYILKL